MVNQKYADQDLLKALRQAASQLSETLSVAKYDQLRDLTSPSSSLIIQRFGSWGAALRLARLKSNSSSRSYQKKFEASEIVQLVKVYLADSINPSYAGFSHWLKANPTAPSAQTCRNTFGSWSSLVAAAKD